MTVDEYFSTGPPFERPIFDAVVAALEPVGPLHVEPVSVGVFLKRGGSFAELRPKTKWVALSFSLEREARHPRIVRKVEPYGAKYFHVANLRSPEDLDDALVDLLTEAYLLTPEA